MLIEQERYDDASPLLRQIQSNQFYLDAQIALSGVIAKQSNVEAGLSYLRNIDARGEDESIRLILEQDLLLRDFDQMDRSLELLTEALEERPEQPDLLYSRGLLAAQMNKIDLIERDMRLLIELQPENAIRIAFFGRPNVGKSSLVNRLLGEERMVVSDIPGTTRDSIDTVLSLNSRNYLLIDTAGIRRKGRVREKLEKFSIIKALAALERCDVALILISAEEGITEQDTRVIGYSQEQGRGCILVVNKWDLVAAEPTAQKRIMAELAMATQFVSFAPVLPLSALTGRGVKKLLPTVAAVHEQFCRTFTTNRLNRLLREAVEAHAPSLHRGRRIKLLYTTQIASRPPTFAIVTNYPKEIHFSYHRYLVNSFRKGLGLDKSPLKIVFRERKRRKISF
jgi:ribosome-associated GTPase EngA